MKQPTRVSQGNKPTVRAKRKTRDQVNAEARDRKRDKKHRGNVAGSRTNPVTPEKKVSNGAKNKDPRIGSKKPVALGGDVQLVKKRDKPAQSAVDQQPRLTSEEELRTLENDPRLEVLLDRLENGETLKAEDQVWLDQTLDRIDVLMEQLGIVLDDDDVDEEAEEDMYRLLKGGT